MSAMHLPLVTQRTSSQSSTPIRLWTPLHRLQLTAAFIKLSQEIPEKNRCLRIRSRGCTKLVQDQHWRSLVHFETKISKVDFCRYLYDALTARVCESSTPSFDPVTATLLPPSSQAHPFKQASASRQQNGRDYAGFALLWVLTVVLGSRE